MVNHSLDELRTSIALEGFGWKADGPMDGPISKSFRPTRSDKSLNRQLLQDDYGPSLCRRDSESWDRTSEEQESRYKSDS